MGRDDGTGAASTGRTGGNSGNGGAGHAGDMELFDLRIVVERIEGRSVCGLRVGDHVEITHSSRLRVPPGRHFCVYALASVLPLVAAKQRPLAPGDWLARDCHVACPDPDERVILRIERTAVRRLRTEDLT